MAAPSSPRHAEQKCPWGTMACDLIWMYAPQSLTCTVMIKQQKYMQANLRSQMCYKPGYKCSGGGAAQGMDEATPRSALNPEVQNAKRS